MGKGREEPPKEDVARALLLRGPLFLHLDPRDLGVVLPSKLDDETQVILQVGLRAVADLRIDRLGVSGTLSFDRAPYYCVVPWSAIYAVTGSDGRGMVWPESMPLELDEEVRREMGRLPPRGLRVVSSQDEPDMSPRLDDLLSDEPQDDQESLVSRSSGRGHLRLVK